LQHAHNQLSTLLQAYGRHVEDKTVNLEGRSRPIECASANCRSRIKVSKPRTTLATLLADSVIASRITKERNVELADGNQAKLTYLE
jgi:hypothetical protein